MTDMSLPAPLSILSDDESAFREAVAAFAEGEVRPRVAAMEAAARLDPDLIPKYFEMGLMGIQVPEEFGGAGIESYLYNVILAEEVSRLPVHLGGIGLHLDVVVPYFLELANDEQKARWFPGLVSGELVSCIGMTEPGMPGVLVGHNEDVAWGFTILGVDQQDLYVEETDPADPNRYLYKGEWRTMTVERELWEVPTHLVGVPHTKLLTPAMIRALHPVDRRLFLAGNVR